MAAASYYRIDSFPNSHNTAGSNLYSGHEYGNHPVHPSGPSRPQLHIAHPNNQSYHSDGNDYHVPPTKPSRPQFHTAHSDSNSHDNLSQHHVDEKHSNPPPKPARNTWNARPPHSTDPATKPLVQPSEAAVPQPLKIQTPNTRLRQRKYQTRKRYLRIGQQATNSISILFSAVIFAIMTYTVITFETTKDEFRGGRTAWPKQSKTWPMFMLLVCAGLTLLLSIITLFSYCCAFKKAQKSWKLTVVKYAIHIGAWVVVSVLYRYERNTHGIPDDIWGWSCSAKAATLQTQFNGVVTFSTLCSAQVRKALTWHDVCLKNPANDSAVKIMGSLDSGGRGQDPLRNRPFRDISQDTKGREAEPGRRHWRCCDRLLRGRHVSCAAFLCVWSRRLPASCVNIIFFEKYAKSPDINHVLESSITIQPQLRGTTVWLGIFAVWRRSSPYASLGFGCGQSELLRVP